MGRDKDQKTEAPGNAFSRMNYLYQAAFLMSENKIPNCLSRYYIKIMKEISKKVVEKLHPDLKRTICPACNYPLTGRADQLNVKIKSHSKRRKNRKKNVIKISEESPKIKTHSQKSIIAYSKARVEARNTKPNKSLWTCSKCNYSKCLLQKPNYKLWIHEIQDKL